MKITQVASSKFASLLLSFAIAAVFFVIVLSARGHHALEILRTLFGVDGHAIEGFSDVLVKAVPILFCALAVAIPGRLGLINIGGEGQLILGAIGATAVAVYFPDLGAFGLVAMIVVSAIAGGVWGWFPGWLKSKCQANETLLSLLMNYLAHFLLLYLIHGPWRDPESLGWPQTKLFPTSYRLPGLAGTRVHIMIFLAIFLCMFFSVVFKRTYYGVASKIITHNVRNARYLGLRVEAFYVFGFILAGMMAAMGGMGEVSGVQGRLRDGISLGYGYAGFFVAWLCCSRMAWLPIASVLFALVVTGADSLQVIHQIPFAAVYLLQGLVFLAMLSSPALRRKLVEKCGGSQ
jgi:general nucleoside transport system permease protein